MKKNAFTLIELMAIIVILGLIILISIPSLTNTIKNTEEKRYNDFLETLYMGTEDYLQLHQDEYPELMTTGHEEMISMKVLIENDCVKSTTKNPKTDRYVSNKDSIKVIRNEDKTFTFEYIEG